MIYEPEPYASFTDFCTDHPDEPDQYKAWMRIILEQHQDEDWADFYERQSVDRRCERLNASLVKIANWITGWWFTIEMARVSMDDEEDEYE